MELVILRCVPTGHISPAIKANWRCDTATCFGPARSLSCCECSVLSGRGLCDELITRPEESYRLCCVVVCDLETSKMGAPYIYGISRLRVNGHRLPCKAWNSRWSASEISRRFSKHSYWMSLLRFANSTDWAPLLQGGRYGCNQPTGTWQSHSKQHTVIIPRVCLVLN